ncbi:MAG TPA: ATP synthase F1 subunit delta [Acidimicrobiales bacterium]|jgi:F-type H+-transporting ATPase subunit delta
MPAATDARIPAYADALFEVARAEGSLRDVEEELFRFAQSLETSDELREALTDQHIPASRRQQIVEDLLGGHALPVTVAMVSMVVGAGRAKDLPAIVRQLVERTAAEANKEVAEVRSAVDLTADQRARLAQALNAATGKQVEVKVIVDPSVLGGIVAQVGDTVIDGSVRSRLEQLKHAF